jgi:hypothetical protein
MVGQKAIIAFERPMLQLGLGLENYLDHSTTLPLILIFCDPQVRLESAIDRTDGHRQAMLHGHHFSRAIAGRDCRAT